MDIPEYKLLESLVIHMLKRMDQNYAYLSEINMSKDSHIEYRHDPFGAKFKFYVVKNKKENENE